MTSIASPSYHLTRSDLDDLASVSVARTDLGSCSASDCDIDDIVSVASSYVSVYVNDVGRPVSEGGALIRVKKSNLGTTTTGRYRLVYVKPGESVAGDWEYHEVIDDIVSVASSYVAVYVDDDGRPVSEGGALIRVKKSNLGTTTTGRYTLVCVKPNESVAGDWEYHEDLDDLDDLDDIPLSPIVETGDPDSVPRPNPTKFPPPQFWMPLRPMPCKPCVLLV